MRGNIGFDSAETHRLVRIDGFKAVLVSTYELGRQPFGLASPAAWLRGAGADVSCVDLSRQSLSDAVVRNADLVACYLPMHTATRLALRVFERVRTLNPSAHLCAYGLYAPMNASFLRNLGVGTILGGEFEEGLLSVCTRLAHSARDWAGVPQPEPEMSLARLRFQVPDRDGLPPLDRYAALILPGGTRRTVGYTEASRGCKHVCRHCPIVPVYNGRFRLVPPDIVLEDIRRQVKAGAGHITFGDPDFFNAARPAVDLVRSLHREHPDLSYDVTIKVQHLLKEAQSLPVLRETGCAFVTSAVESVDDAVLERLDKGHTRADFSEVVRLMREIGLAFSPTFVAFHPWIRLEGYEDLLATLADLDLVESVHPVQLAIRLLIPAGSRLLELEEVRALVKPFDGAALLHPWTHQDPRVDALQQDLDRMIQRSASARRDRREVFEEAWERLQQAMGHTGASLSPSPPLRSRAAIPYLNEPWYC